MPVHSLSCVTFSQVPSSSKAAMLDVGQTLMQGSHHLTGVGKGKFQSSQPAGQLKRNWSQSALPEGPKQALASLLSIALKCQVGQGNNIVFP